MSLARKRLPSDRQPAVGEGGEHAPRAGDGRRVDVGLDHAFFFVAAAGSRRTLVL